MSATDLPETRGYSGWTVLVSAAVGLVVAFLLSWWAAGFGTFYETLFRVGPTVEGAGIGADWVTGNTLPVLDFLIALTHAADVILGLFVLFLLFLHWAAFRRLAARMRGAGTTTGETVLADGEGGERE